MDRLRAAEVLGISLLDSKNLAKIKYLQQLQSYRTYIQSHPNGEPGVQERYENISETYSAYFVFIGEKNALVGDDLHDVPTPEKPENIQGYKEAKQNEIKHENSLLRNKTLNNTQPDPLQVAEDVPHTVNINSVSSNEEVIKKNQKTRDEFFSIQTPESTVRWNPPEEWGPPSVTLENDSNPKDTLNQTRGSSDITKSIQNSFTNNTTTLQEYRHNAFTSSAKPGKLALYIFLGGVSLILLIGIVSLAIEFINTAEIIIVEEPKS